MTASLDYQDRIAVLRLGDDENRFSPEWLDAVERALDKVVNGEPTALITVADGKFYSNGLDLDWLLANSDQAGAYTERVQALLARVLTLPVPTVAAVTGHAFGAGAMFAIAHDFRVMRADRGYFCFPEVDIELPFAPGMAALVQAKLTPQTAMTAMTTGRRYGGAAAATAGIVDVAAPENEVLAAARAIVEPLVGKDPGTLGNIKSTMFDTVTTLLKSS